MDTIFKKSFRFVANRFEEWQQGCCISRGAIQTNITAEASSNNISFELNGIDNLRILESFSFEFGNSHILQDRIQYVHGSSDMNPITPFICQLFFQGNELSYIRFAMTNPDRIIEFYGTLVELGQAPRNGHKIVETKNVISAESVLRELNSYGSMNSAAVMERAVKIYNEYSSVATIDDVLALVEGLKLFIKANKIEEEEKVNSSSMLKPKILMFIALCNYKIDNINAAYCIAKKGLDAIDKALENSSLSGIPKSMLGGDTLKEIVNMIEVNHADEIRNKDYSHFDENIIETKRLKEVYGINISVDKEGENPKSKKFILSLINKFDELRNDMMSLVINNNNSNAMQISFMLHDIASSVFYAWEYYGYGHMSDFWKEDLTLETYAEFKSDLVHNLEHQLYAFTNGLFPLKAIDEDNNMQHDMILVLEALLEDLDRENNDLYL